MDKQNGPIVGFVVTALAVLIFVPEVCQDPSYHNFVDTRTLWGIPNFWNVVSNVGFLLVAIYGTRALASSTAFVERWERTAYITVLIGLALVAFGSSYYHWQPNTTTLFWDRLPMTIVFMALLATTIGERIAGSIAWMLLWPLIAAGIGAVLEWRVTGDLRLYGVVQFYPMLAVLCMLVFLRPRYTCEVGLYATLGFYALAKLLELFDQKIGAILPTGGHPWKHVAVSIATSCYVTMVANRRPLGEHLLNPMR